jgi:hypothetical protein
VCGVVFFMVLESLYELLGLGRVGIIFYDEAEYMGVTIPASYVITQIDINDAPRWNFDTSENAQRDLPGILESLIDLQIVTMKAAKRDVSNGDIEKYLVDK